MGTKEIRLTMTNGVLFLPCRSCHQQRAKLGLKTTNTYQPIYLTVTERRNEVGEEVGPYPLL